MIPKKLKLRPRAKDLGINIGLLPHGQHNTITDVEGVKIGHSTIIRGNGQLKPGEGPVRTGITIVLPHSSNLYKAKVPAAAYILNGFGKSLGLTQVMELGRLESPIALTSTLNVWRVADSMIEYLSDSNPGVQSFNPVVIECNDRFLNDSIGRHVGKSHLIESITNASTPSLQEGNVGAGTGMSGFGWKAGIGTSSRICESLEGKYTVGVLVLCNMGDPKDLRIDSLQVGRYITPPGVNDESGGSVCFIVATNAPLTARQLGRLASRAPIGLARTGGIVSHGSGTLSIAFSNSDDRPKIDDAHLSTIFRGVVEATEEAIINSVLKAETLIGRDGNIRHAIPIDSLTTILNAQQSALEKIPTQVRQDTNKGES